MVYREHLTNVAHASKLYFCFEPKPWGTKHVAGGENSQLGRGPAELFVFVK